MIVGTTDTLQIGQRAKGIGRFVTPLFRIEDDHPDQPFTVIREATFEEYRAEQEDEAGRAMPLRVVLALRNPKFKYYEIATD